MNKGLVAAALLCLACAVLQAQAQSSSGGDDLDGLFAGDGTTPASAAAEPPDAEVPAAAVRADDPTRDQRIHYFASLNIYGLLGLGWSGLPDPNDINVGLGNEGNGALTASLGIDIRPAQQLRLRGTLSYNFPKTGTQLSELIVDYSIREAVFFRLGIFDYTWGISQFFQFTNLPSRGDWGIESEPLWQQTNIITKSPTTDQPVSIRMSIPFGLNNLTFLARFDMLNYGFPDSTTPDPLDAGYGIQLDLVTGPIEWTLAGFWQRLVTPRSSLSMKTSLLGFDFSVETTMAFPVKFTLDRVLPIETTGGGIYVGGVMQRIYPTAVIGVSREWTDARIKMYAEYAFNSEREPGNPGTSWLGDNIGPGGHNSAVVVRFRDFASTGIALNLLWQQNWSDGSGLVSPLLEISPVPLTTIQFGPVFVYDPYNHGENAEVISNRLVPGRMQAELLLLVKVSESYRQ